MINKLYNLIDPIESLDTTQALNRTAKFLEFLDNPHKKINHIVHVAGTSGKGTTCYYTSQLLMQHGLRVGTIVSPHVYSVGERAMINLNPQAFQLNKHLHLVRDYKETGAQLGYFEALVGLALNFFSQQKIDVAVIETGLGGRLDGTNVLQAPNKICVLTNIGMDHQQWLGNNIESIASEKAGIIGPGNAVITTANQQPDVLGIFKTVAAKNNTTLDICATNTDIALAQPGTHNQSNASLAHAATSQLLAQAGKEFKSTSLESLKNMQLPGRFEQVVHEEKKIILDGAHNTQKMSALLGEFTVEDTLVVVLDNLERIGRSTFAGFEYAVISHPQKDLPVIMSSTQKPTILITGTLKKLAETKKILSQIA